MRNHVALHSQQYRKKNSLQLSNIEWTEQSRPRFYPKMETDSSLRNVVLLIKSG
jgi:hypothetical protein